MNPGKRTDRIWLAGSTIPWPTFRRPSEPQAPEVEFKAPGFELVARQFSEFRRSDILDLGSPLRANVEYLSQFSCVLHIGDIFRALADEPEMSEAEDERDVEGVAGRLIAYEDDIRFDAIFVWDVFDYLDSAMSHAVVYRLGHYCRTGTLLYLMTSNRETIPDEPGRFTIIDDQHLRFERRGAGTREGMRYSPRALERIMRGFRLQHSFLLAHEMQEYLFIHT